MLSCIRKLAFLTRRSDGVRPPLGEAACDFGRLLEIANNAPIPLVFRPSRGNYCRVGHHAC